MTCEMTLDGPQCGNTAGHGVGVVHPVTDHYCCVLLSCRSCASRLMAETTARFRVLDLDLAHRLRMKLAAPACS